MGVVGLLHLQCFAASRRHAASAFPHSRLAAVCTPGPSNGPLFLEKRFSFLARLFFYFLQQNSAIFCLIFPPGAR